MQQGQIFPNSEHFVSVFKKGLGKSPPPPFLQLVAPPKWLYKSRILTRSGTERNLDQVSSQSSICCDPKLYSLSQILFKESELMLEANTQTLHFSVALFDQGIINFTSQLFDLLFMCRLKDVVSPFIFHLRF